MMKFLAVALIALVGVVHCSKICTGSDDDVGVFSGVVCVSRTQFKFKGDTGGTNIMACPIGTVCADVQGICSATAPAFCLNEVAGETGTCGICRDSSAHQICTSDTQYTLCNGGILLPALTYSCATGKFCKYDAKKLEITCVANSKDSDCSLDATNPGNSTDPGDNGGSGGGSTLCTAEGLFPYKTDPSCVRYYKCTKTSSGGYTTADFQCATKGYAFNPYTQRCELNYECSK